MKFILFDEFLKVLESKQISEATSGQQDYGEFMKFAKSQINFYKQKSKYPKLKQAISDLNLDEIDDLQDVDDKSFDYEEAIQTKIKEQMKDQIEKINQSELPVEQKKAQRLKLREREKEVIEKAKDLASAKVQAEKTKIGKQYDLYRSKISDKVKELNSDFPVESDNLSKKLEEFKIEVDMKIELDELDKKYQKELSTATDPEQQKRILANQQKAEQRVKSDFTERLSTQKIEAKEAEEEFKKRLEGADEKTKEALEKLSDFQEKLGKFMSLASGYSEDSTDEEVGEIVNARSEMNDAKEKITPGLLKKAGLATEDDAEQMAETLKGDADEAIESFKDVKSLEKSKSKENKTSEEGSEGDKSAPSEEEPTAGQSEPKEGGSKKTEFLKKEITDKIAKAKEALAAAASSPNPKQAVIDGIKSQIEKKKKELLGLGESNLDYEIKLLSISRDVDKIMEEIKTLSKPWYRKSDGALNESISQKFSRLLNKKV